MWLRGCPGSLAVLDTAHLDVAGGFADDGRGVVDDHARVVGDDEALLVCHLLLSGRHDKVGLWTLRNGSGSTEDGKGDLLMRSVELRSSADRGWVGGERSCGE